MPNNLIKLGAVSVFLLSGCAIQRVNDVQKSANDTDIKTTSLIQQMGDNFPVVQFNNSQYINTSPILKPKYEAPPKVANCSVTYKTISPQTIFQFSQDMTEQCGIRVRVTPDAAAYLRTGGNSEPGSPTQRLSSVPLPVMANTPMQPLGSFSDSSQSSQVSAIPTSGNSLISNISYSGLLGSLLDQVTGLLGVSWRFEQNTIIIYYLETRRFDIQPADAKYTLKGSVTSGLSNSTGTDSGGDSGSSGGVSGSGGSTMSSTVEMGNNLYDDLKTTVQSMLTPGTGRLSLNATTGTLMVTDVPEVIAHIGEYLDAENSTLSRQVIFKVVTYTINTNTSDLAGINWNLIWKSLNGNYGIKLANTASGSATDAISGGFNVLDTATGSAAQFAGSSFLLDALSKQASVSDVKTNTIMTTNMAAAPILVGEQTTYLKDVSTTPYTTGSSTVPTQSLTPGSVTTGTNITILPKILKDSNVLMMNMFMEISNLKDLRVISSDTQKIEAPEINMRSIQQRVWLKAGQTLIMNGFEQNINDSRKQGVGSPNNILLGGSLSGAKTKQSFVITVTPYVR